MSLDAVEAFRHRRLDRRRQIDRRLLLLHKAIASDPKLRVLILDPHNEFAAAFPDIGRHRYRQSRPALLADEARGICRGVFRGRPPVPEELDILRDVIPEAKRAFRGSTDSLARRTSEKSSITADTPVPTAWPICWR
jgi:hypothetical protein